MEVWKRNVRDQFHREPVDWVKWLRSGPKWLLAYVSWKYRRGLERGMGNGNPVGTAWLTSFDFHSRFAFLNHSFRWSFMCKIFIRKRSPGKSVGAWWSEMEGRNEGRAGFRQGPMEWILGSVPRGRTGGSVGDLLTGPGLRKGSQKLRASTKQGENKSPAMSGSSCSQGEWVSTA